MHEAHTHTHTHTQHTKQSQSNHKAITKQSQSKPKERQMNHSASFPSPQCVVLRGGARVGKGKGKGIGKTTAKVYNNVRSSIYLFAPTLTSSPTLTHVQWARARPGARARARVRVRARLEWKWQLGSAVMMIANSWRYFLPPTTRYCKPTTKPLQTQLQNTTKGPSIPKPTHHARCLPTQFTTKGGRGRGQVHFFCGRGGHPRPDG